MINIIRRLHFSTEDQTAQEALLRALPAAGRQTIILPLPMSAVTWQRTIFERSVAPEELFSRILTDRPARLLFHGLAGLDSETRGWIERQPSLLRSLYRDDEAVRAFALFAPAVQVRAGRVAVPGDATAAERWSAIVGARLDEPSRFVTRLFRERGGRIAGLYFVSAFVDPARRKFLIGDGRGSDDRFGALVNAFSKCYPSQSTDYPFAVRSRDPAWLLLNVKVSDDGAVAGPRSREFWDGVFDDGDIRPFTAGSDGPIDAAWLVDRLCSASSADRGKVFDTFLAGQRMFGDLAGADMPPAVRALRVRRRYPSLFVAMERAGLRDPASIANIGDGARQLDRLDDMESAPVALQQFQGAVSLVLGAARMQTVTIDRAQDLMTKLAALPLRNGRYEGRVALWLERELLPALRSSSIAAASLTAEELVARALAGKSPTTARRIHWEGRDYTLDPAEATRLRLLRVRKKQGGPTLDEALASAGAAKNDAAVRASDAILGKTLASWAYAPQIGDADSGALVGGDPSIRHDLGIRAVNRTLYDQRWEVAVAPRDGGRIAASYLSMDAALAPWSLRRLSSDRVPAPPTLPDNDRLSLVSALAFSRPDRLSDDTMQAIATAIAQGSSAIQSAKNDAQALDGLASQASLSPWRRAVLSWMAVNEPGQIAAQFSPSARATLGGLRIAGIEEWGTSGVTVGCHCLRPPMAHIPELIYGRPVDGIVGASSADLAYRIAQLLTQLKLPAPLATSVMTFALRDYVDALTLAHPADTEAFGRQAWQLTLADVEDYVGAVAANGALRPLRVQ